MDSRAKHYRYLIIGGGMTADAAVGGEILERDNWKVYNAG
jgi:hypothetical protein